MKIGDYVRLVRKNITYIRKINSIYLKRMGAKNINEIIVDKPFDYRYTINDDKILRSSSNIIDLLEKSDLVVDNYGNIYVVDYVFDNYIYTTTKQGNIVKTLCDYQIKQILTHEEFDAKIYRVGD